MTRQLVGRESIVRLWGSIADTHDIGNLLTKISKDLHDGELESARFKLEVLGSIYDTVPGCAFFRSTECNYAHYLGLRQAYEEKVKIQAEK